MRYRARASSNHRLSADLHKVEKPSAACAFDEVFYEDFGRPRIRNTFHRGQDGCSRRSVVRSSFRTLVPTVRRPSTLRLERPLRPTGLLRSWYGAGGQAISLGPVNGFVAVEWLWAAAVSSLARGHEKTGEKEER